MLPESCRRVCRALCIAVLVCTVPASFAASIHGTVTNLTTNKPSAGDVVALIQLQQSMQIVAHATTDAHGHYTIEVSDGAAMHLVRVTHEGANYFQPVPPGTQQVNVNVYDAAERVPGVTTEADVQRIQTDKNGLMVIENYFVKNASSPPRTQFGRNAYRIYLPKNAEIVSSAALGPGSMPVQSSPVPTGQPGAYSFIFPLRPGETRFQVTYKLPYTGNYQFQPKVAAPVDNFAVILPKSIHFTGNPPEAFLPVDEDVRVQTYLVKNLAPTAKISFNVAGSGVLPQETTQADNSGSAAASQNPEAAAQRAAIDNTRPGIGLGVPIDTPDPLRKYMWWIISAAVVLLVIGAGISVKRTGPAPQVAVASASGAASVPRIDGPLLPIGSDYSAAQPATPAPQQTRPPASMLETLKEELFSLETDRLNGKLSNEEYEKQKNALEIVLKRALERTSGQTNASA